LGLWEQIIQEAMADFPANHVPVGGFNPSEKYESQIGSSSLLGKIKVIFQTTNQSWFMVDINYRLYTIRSLIYHKFTLW
jgi:hypothetical protein